MNCPNCHRMMNLVGSVQYSCPYCGVQGFNVPSESALFSITWLDAAPCFKPISPHIGATQLYSAPVPVMKFLTTDCTYKLQL